MVQVWRLNKIPHKSNTHGIGNLSESWSFSRDKEFPDRSSAEAYVVQQNYIHAGFDLRLHHEPWSVIRNRCLDNTEWMSYWTCFLDLDDKESRSKSRELIIEQLRKRRISVIQ